MSFSRRTFRLLVLATIGFSLTACHFHRNRCGGGHHYHRPVIRICR